MHLLHLEFQFYSRFTLRPWSLDVDSRQSLSALGKGLKVFGYAGPPQLPGSNPPALSEQLRCFISGENLIKLEISFLLGHCRQSSLPAGVGPLLACLSSRATLRWLSLAGCSCTLGVLQELLRRCGPKRMFSSLQGIRLLDGTWTEALALLQQTARAGGAWSKSPHAARWDEIFIKRSADRPVSHRNMHAA